MTLQVRPEELEISVADTGIGMPEEVRSHVFDKYYQGSRSSGSGRGLGLGLSIVYRILELCGGQVRVDSVVDQGSTFTVRLPCPQHYKILDAVLFFLKNKRPTQLNCVGLSLWWR